MKIYFKRVNGSRWLGKIFVENKKNKIKFSWKKLIFWFIYLFEKVKDYFNKDFSFFVIIFKF